MPGMFVCNHCKIESRDPKCAPGPWFMDRANDFDLCPTCRTNWEEDGPMGKDERYVRVSSEDAGK